LFFCGCKKDPPELYNPDFLNHGPQYDVYYLSGHVWEVYASCDSVSMDTIVHNDTLNFYSTPSDAYVSWNHNPRGEAYLAYLIPDEQHTHFIMNNTPYGNILGITAIDSIAAGHLSHTSFRNSSAHTATYLWMRRIQ
jgi:hypothetical protein